MRVRSHAAHDRAIDLFSFRKLLRYSTILAKTPMFNNLRPVNVMQPTRPHSHRRRHGLSSTRWLHFAIVQLKFMADSLCLHSANSLNDVNIGIDFITNFPHINNKLPTAVKFICYTLNHT